MSFQRIANELKEKNMSKRIPVDLTEEDIKLLLLAIDCCDGEGFIKLKTRLNEALDTFKTKLEQVVK